MAKIYNLRRGSILKIKGRKYRVTGKCAPFPRKGKRKRIVCISTPVGGRQLARVKSRK